MEVLKLYGDGGVPELIGEELLLNVQFGVVFGNGQLGWQSLHDGQRLPAHEFLDVVPQGCPVVAASLQFGDFFFQLQQAFTLEAVELLFWSYAEPADHRFQGHLLSLEEEAVEPFLHFDDARSPECFLASFDLLVGQPNALSQQFRVVRQEFNLLL